MDKIDKIIAKIIYEITYIKYKYLKRKYQKTQEKLLLTLTELSVLDSVMRQWR